jgi:hypothetical protein
VTDDKTIRKAFELKLAQAMAAAGYQADAALPGCQIRWPGLAWSDAGLAVYARPSFHTSDLTPKTMGPSARVSTRGIFSVGLFARFGQSQDQLDDLNAVVRAAYPFGTDLAAGAVKVQVDKINLGPPLEPPGWLYQSLSIIWSIGI